MPASRLRSLLLAVVLVSGACGDDSGGIATTTTVVATTTTAATATTTTTSMVPLQVPLASLEGATVEDPCFDSGFHAVERVDDRDDILRIVDPPRVVALAPLEEAASTSGLDGDHILLATQCRGADEVIFLGIAMFSRAGEAWEAGVSVQGPAILEILEGMSGYAAVGHEGPAIADPTLVSFDWTGVADFVLDVEVWGDPPVGDPVYTDQLSCTHDGATLDCVSLLDDGVLRPGDEGEDVEALQQALADLGYLDGPIDGKYGPGTEAAVRSFQRDFWLARDGRAGPQTRALIDDLLSGDSDLILIDLDQIGPIDFMTPQNDVIRPTANPNVYQGALVALLGQPDDYDAYVDGCDGENWIKASWGAFTAILTTRDGPMQLDGWAITDLGSLDSRFRIGGGIRPTWRWSDFEAAGAGYDPTYGEFFYMFDLGYNNGRFVSGQGATPSANAVIRGFGTGTGAFVSC